MGPLAAGTPARPPLLLSAVRGGHPRERSHPAGAHAGQRATSAGSGRQEPAPTANGPRRATCARRRAPGRGQRGQREERLAAVAPPCGRQAAPPPSCPESAARPDSARRHLRPAWVARPLSPLPLPLARSAPRYLGQLPMPARRGGRGGTGRSRADGRVRRLRAPRPGAAFPCARRFRMWGAERPPLWSRSEQARRGSHGALTGRHGAVTGSGVPAAPRGGGTAPGPRLSSPGQLGHACSCGRSGAGVSNAACGEPALGSPAAARGGLCSSRREDPQALRRNLQMLERAAAVLRVRWFIGKAVLG